MWIAPRGIVAAAVAGLFGAQLTQKGYEGAELLLPLIFALIILTVTMHGLSIGWIARKLDLASKHPDGIMIVGASPWSTAFAAEIQKNDVPVMLIDTRWKHLKAARMQNIPTHYGEILSETTEEVLELSHITKLVAVTPNEAYNTLICSRFAPELGHHNVYEMGWKNMMREMDGKEKDTGRVPSQSIRGDSLFGGEISYEEFRDSYAHGWKFESTPLTEKYGIDNVLEDKPQGSKLIAAIDDTGNVHLYPWNKEKEAENFNLVISYVPADKDTTNDN